jgi:hypothetical protein
MEKLWKQQKAAKWAAEVEMRRMVVKREEIPDEGVCCCC